MQVLSDQTVNNYDKNQSRLKLNSSVRFKPNWTPNYLKKLDKKILTSPHCNKVGQLRRKNWARANLRQKVRNHHKYLRRNPISSQVYYFIDKSGHPTIAIYKFPLIVC